MPRTQRISRVLIIAGSDSGGGAGIQGDIKTVTCLGGYAATAITALTAQNTEGVFGIHEVPVDFIKQQITLVLEDIGADALKTGMLHSATVIETVAEAIAPYPAIPLVLDPVMVAKGGAPLLQREAIESMKKHLIPRAAIITPNIPEAELLSDIEIHNVEDMRKAAQKILALGAKAVLVKGGHLKITGETITDLLLTLEGEITIQQKYIDTPHTHGTGCTLASAIATGIAQGLSLKDAVRRAEDYVAQAIANAPGLGKGHGPLKHNWMIGIT